MGVAVKLEPPPTHMGLRVVSPDGVPARWSEDETRSENVLGDIEFSGEIPGGHKELSGTLARDPRRDWGDIRPYSTMELRLLTGEVLWQGSLDKAPDVSGDQMSISPSALGYQAILEDNAVQIGIIDGDLSRWGDPSTQRRKDILATGGTPQALSQEVNVGFQDQGAAGAGIFFQLGSITEAQWEIGEQWAYFDGVDVGSVLYDFISNNPEDATYFDEVFIFPTDVVTANLGVSTNYKQKETLAQRVDATAAGGKYVAIRCAYTGVGTGDNFRNMHGYVNMRVLGRHGMTLQGTWPQVGFSTKQCLEYIIKNFASPLFTEEQYVEEDGVIIPQAWYGTPEPPAGAVKDVTKYGVNFDWFVYNGKRLDYREAGSYGRFWKSFVAESQLNEVGVDSQRLWQQIIVQYTDVNGNTRTVGPSGSGCNVESTELEITDPNHPAVLASRTRRDVLDLQGIGNPETAIIVGKRFLEEANLLNRSGSATLTGLVMNNKGILYPAAVVKAGDFISFVDAADNSYRKVMDHKWSGKEMTIDVDAPSGGLEALLERLQVGLISLGVN